MLNRKLKNKRFQALAGLVWFWLVAAAGCTAVSPPPANDEATLTVFAAASLTDAFSELGQAFEAKNDSTQVVFNFAGSSQLAVQLREGAVADIFASANETQMATAVSANRIQANTVQPFATNHLSLIVPADNPANIASLADVANPGVRLILAASGVPVRDYTDAMLQALPPDFQASVYANLVSEGQNVRQVVAQITLGEADAGIVYRSDVTPSVAASVQQIPLPEAQSVQANYPLAIVAEAPQPALAQQFIDFALSAEGQAILSKWGFGPPPGESR
jgi:molybdate transport system substrate-binding protein